MRSGYKFNRLISIILILSLIISMVGCSSSPPVATLSSPNNQVLVENTLTENVISEEILHEFITTENYLEEIVVVEDTISEMLLEEDIINEVLTCKTIYIPQNNIDEFAENSQTSHLFGEGINLKSVLAKLAVGTGVVVTIVVLKKAGFPEPVMSIVASAAERSLEFAGTGAAIGCIIGGAGGAADEIDETGRTSAIIGFATAVVGLVIAGASLIASVPSGGTSSITAVEGIKILIAGIATISAAVGSVKQGINLYDTYTTTDAADIDWDNIDWGKVGVTAAEKAIEGAADGYVMGSIVGAVYGGVEGYEYYEKFNTPYTTKKMRLDQTPKSGGKWTGERGESDFVLDEPITLKDGTVVKKVTYKNGVPDFSPFEKAKVKISKMTNKRYGKDNNFDQADQALAKKWNDLRHEGKKTWTAKDIENYRNDNNLTWHEMSNMESVQLVPREINSSFGHCGGCAEYSAMIGEEEPIDFD